MSPAGVLPRLYLYPVDTVSRQCGHTRQRLDSDDTGLDCEKDKTKTQTKTAGFEELCGLVEQLNFSLAVEV